MSSTLHYYVDESGSGVLFDKRGRVLIGQEGVPRFFSLGLLQVVQPKQLDQEIQALQRQIESDPYYEQVPSVQKRTLKGPFFFHATDDVPEIRRLMFQLLRNCDVKFFAVVKDMHEVLTYVQNRNQSDPDYRYNNNELYDFTARMLFKHRLHKSDSHEICFAKRGSRTRTASLKQALEFARDRFLDERDLVCSSNLNINTVSAEKDTRLQAVDYFLWALQRCFERGEDRYLTYLWERVSLVHDVDDKRKAGYGEYYNKKRPLTAASIKRPEDIG
jgi:hypothetical protein